MRFPVCHPPQSTRHAWPSELVGVAHRESRVKKSGVGQRARAYFKAEWGPRPCLKHPHQFRVSAGGTPRPSPTPHPADTLSHTLTLGTHRPLPLTMAVAVPAATERAALTIFNEFDANGDGRLDKVRRGNRVQRSVGA